jgi:hypothetical protein
MGEERALALLLEALGEVTFEGVVRVVRFAG